MKWILKKILKKNLTNSTSEAAGEAKLAVVVHDATNLGQLSPVTARDGEKEINMIDRAERIEDLKKDLASWTAELTNLHIAARMFEAVGEAKRGDGSDAYGEYMGSCMELGPEIHEADRAVKHISEELVGLKVDEELELLGLLKASCPLETDCDFPF